MRTRIFRNKDNPRTISEVRVITKNLSPACSSTGTAAYSLQDLLKHQGIYQRPTTKQRLQPTVIGFHFHIYRLRSSHTLDFFSPEKPILLHKDGYETIKVL